MYVEKHLIISATVGVLRLQHDRQNSDYSCCWTCRGNMYDGWCWSVALCQILIPLTLSLIMLYKISEHLLELQGLLKSQESLATVQSAPPSSMVEFVCLCVCVSLPFYHSLLLSPSFELPFPVSLSFYSHPLPTFFWLAFSVTFHSHLPFHFPPSLTFLACSLW